MSTELVQVATGATPEDLLARLPEDIAALLRQMAQESGFEGAKAFAEAQARAAVASGERQEDIAVDEAVERFVRDLRAGKSPATATTYRAGLRRFLAHLAGLPPGERPAMVSELAPRHAVDFARALTEPQAALKRGSMQNYVTAVSRLYGFLLREGYRGGDLPMAVMAERLKPLRGRVVRRIPRVPDDAVVAALLAAARAHPPGKTL